MSKSKIILIDMKELAKKKGGSCLSDKYIDTRTKLIWECGKKHIWYATRSTVLKHWCPTCANENRKLSLKELDKIASMRGGKCLIDHYINNEQRIKWQCSKGHIWEAKVSNVKFGTWCPKCVGKKLDIDDMQKLAKRYGGSCISSKYINNQIKLKWQCNKGHKWFDKPYFILKYKRWCPICENRKTFISPLTGGRIRLNIEDAQLIARKKGGSFLSNTVNSQEKLTWKCSNGHIFKSYYSNIKKGHWCPHCSGNAKLTIEDMNKIAEKKYGKCLSKEYINGATKLEWQCGNGHRWYATPHSIRKGSWCAKCSVGTSENICRYFFEYLFNNKFPKVRPNWLRSPKNNLLELDGYSEELNIAFEYQGKQHYQNLLHMNKESLETRKMHDRIKLKKCRERDITLFIIPYYIPYHKLQTYILDAYHKTNLKYAINNNPIDFKNIPLLNIYKIKEAEKIAQNRGGVCLSKYYLNSKNKILWQCKNKHIWESRLDHTNNGAWCPSCSGYKKYTIEDIKDLASSRGGYCISSEYINAHTKMSWKCQNGHIWTNTPNNIRHGSWCPKCSGKK